MSLSLALDAKGGAFRIAAQYYGSVKPMIHTRPVPVVRAQSRLRKPAKLGPQLLRRRVAEIAEIVTTDSDISSGKVKE